MNGPSVTSSPGPTLAVPSSPPNPGLMKVSMPEEDCRQEACTTKRFSPSILNEKLEEYKAGKYTDKYIRTYLDFVHLEGIIDNIQYLELRKGLGDFNG